MENATLTQARFRSSYAALAGLCFTLVSCDAVTIFQSSFSSNTVGSPPAHTQATGTVDVSGDPGSVVITGPVSGSTGNWAKISRAEELSSISVMQCNLTGPSGQGSYSMLAALFIPTGSGLATVEFASANLGPGPIGFLHLDFLENNTIRLDDDNSQVFGTFPRDQFFTVAVTLEVTASSTAVHIQLYGTGASGTKDYNVTTPSLATQFGSVRFWMGYPWIGSFYVTDILVSKKS